MDIIILPPHLADEPNLAAINQRLLAGEATLDWSQVNEASLEELHVLLANLDLVENSDVLGIDSVPGDLAELVLQAIAPEVWETEQAVAQDDDASEDAQYHRRGEGGEERKGGPLWSPALQDDSRAVSLENRSSDSPITSAST